MQFLRLLFTLLFISLGGIVGFQFSHVLNQADFFSQSPNAALVNDVVLTLIGSIVGFLVSPYFFRSFLKYMEELTKGMEKFSLQEILWGAGGLIFGLAVSSLITYTLINPVLSYFDSISKEASIIKPIFIALTTLFFTTIILLLTVRLPFHARGHASKKSRPKILDTSAIIDGRIADVFETQFLEGTIIIPKFVLDELQLIADSSDALKRNRGRRGLDILNRMRQSKLFHLQFVEKETPGNGVDSKLVNLAKDIQGAIVTNDYNLNKVAQFQEVAILNINELANAVKPVVLPGEELNVQVIREGKEQNQGVAYLDDGTMIVVENGKRYLGDKIKVEVTSVLQTLAGKMIFARLK